MSDRRARGESAAPQIALGPVMLVVSLRDRSLVPSLLAVVAVVRRASIDRLASHLRR